MKLPKTTNRFCPSCVKKTEHKIKLVATGTKRGTLTKGSLARMKIRGSFPGMGNKGRGSKPSVNKWKRKTKTTKRNVFLYTCQVCKKAHQSKNSLRASKVLIE